MKTGLCSILLTIFCSTAFGATIISGDIDTLNFDSKNNPYIIEKDIIIPKGKTVSIPEGVVLLFNQFTGFQVAGKLIVQGTNEQPVIFTSINEKNFNSQSEQLPNPFDWNGVFVTKDADGAYMNHFSLKYSVYGVKSQCKNIIIQNAVFQQNGQFHFTVNEQVQFVQDNIPFSYGESGDSQTVVRKTIDDNQVSTTDNGTTNQRTKKANKKAVLVWRYTSLGVGVAGGIAAIICGVQMNKNLDKCNEISKNNTSYNDWNTYSDKYNNYKAGTIISSVIGGLGLAGFAITFAF